MLLIGQHASRPLVVSMFSAIYANKKSTQMFSVNLKKKIEKYKQILQ
jgi:hypothetical protein